MKRLLLYVIIVFSAVDCLADKISYVPKFAGTIRTNYQYLTRQEKGAFKVRNLRLGIEGNVAPIMSYRGEVDFADWGKVILIDAYIKLTPIKKLYFSMGQLRMPFTIAAHRMPHQQYFVNRTFLAKQGGSIRDIGITGGYTVPKLPLTGQLGFFNCSGTGENKAFFTNTYGFSAKLISQFGGKWYVSGSTARLTRGMARIQMWDIGGYFHTDLWHIEAEYLRKLYVNGGCKPVNAWDIFVYRDFPLKSKTIKGVSGAVRYDYMGDHSSGNIDEKGKLIIDDPSRHRITLGSTLSFKTKMQAEIRLNYEKYFFEKGVAPSLADDDRLVLELIAHFD